jgi:hypothetical protein
MREKRSKYDQKLIKDEISAKKKGGTDERIPEKIQRPRTTIQTHTTLSRPACGLQPPKSGG